MYTWLEVIVPSHYKASFCWEYSYSYGTEAPALPSNVLWIFYGIGQRSAYAEAGCCQMWLNRLVRTIQGWNSEDLNSWLNQHSLGLGLELHIFVLYLATRKQVCVIVFNKCSMLGCWKGL